MAVAGVVVVAAGLAVFLLTRHSGTTHHATDKSSVGSSPSTTVPARAPAASGGRVVHNAVVQVTLPDGWSVSAQSTATNLVLDGPRGLAASMTSRPTPEGATLPNVLTGLETGLERHNGSNARVCAAPTATSMPGGLGRGVAFAVCSTYTEQGRTLSIEVAVAATLRAVGGSPRLFEADLIFPRGVPDARLERVYGPVAASIHWVGVPA